MFDFYALLLTLTVTLGGILLAVLLFYMQLVASQYSPQVAHRVSRTVGTRAFLWVAALGCGLSLAGVVVSALAPPKAELTAHPMWSLLLQWFSGPFGIGLAVVFLVLGIAVFIIAIKDCAASSSATVVVSRLAEQAAPELMAQFCYEAYGHPTGASAADVQPVLDRLHKRGHGPVPDVVAAVAEVASTALGEHDLATWNAACEALLSIVRKWTWSSAEELPRRMRPAFPVCKFDGHLVRLLHERLSFMRETCVSTGHVAAEEKIVEIWRWTAVWAVTYERRVLLEGAVAELSCIGTDAARGERTEIFGSAIRALVEVALGDLSASISYDHSSFEIVTDAVLRLIKTAAARADPDEEQYYLRQLSPTVMAESLSAVSELSGHVCSNLASLGAQPARVAADIITITAHVFLAAGDLTEGRESCAVRLLSCLSDIGEAAAKCGDSAVCCYCARKLLELHGELNPVAVDFRELPSDIERWIVELPQYWLASQADPGTRPGLGRSLVEEAAGWCTALGVEVMQRETHEMHRQNMDLPDGSQRTWQFIKEVGHRLNSNFGFRFDPVTKNDYADTAGE